MSSKSSILLDQTLLKCRKNVNLLRKTPVVFHGAALPRSPQGTGSMRSFCVPQLSIPRGTYCVWQRLLFLFSGSLGQSDILSAKSDAEKNLCLSCPLKNKERGGVFAVDQSATIWREVEAFGFHETTWTRYEARVGLLGQVSADAMCPDSQPFLSLDKE